MPVQDTSGATANVLRARGMMIDNANQQRMSLRQAAGGIGESIGASVQSSKNDEIKAQMREALSKAGLDPTIAESGPRAAALALMQEHQRKTDRVDAMAQKELDRGYEESRYATRKADLATALADERSYNEKQETARNTQEAGLVAPGLAPKPGGFLNFGPTPATPGLAMQRYGSGKFPMVSGQRATSLADALKPETPKTVLPRNIDPLSPEGIAAKRELEGPPETPEAKLARIRAEARERAAGTNEGGGDPTVNAIRELEKTMKQRQVETWEPPAVQTAGKALADAEKNEREFLDSLSTKSMFQIPDEDLVKQRKAELRADVEAKKAALEQARAQGGSAPAQGGAPAGGGTQDGATRVVGGKRYVRKNGAWVAE